jgi:sugar lactone lactonase YvrE
MCRAGGGLLEGPTWDMASARLLLVDIVRCRLIASMGKP